MPDPLATVQGRMDPVLEFDDQSRRPNPPLAFPCTLAMIRKVATMIGPGSRRSLIRMAGLVYD